MNGACGVRVRVFVEATVRGMGPDARDDVEFMRLGDFVRQFQKGAAIDHREALARALGPRRLDERRRGREALSASAAKRNLGERRFENAQFPRRAADFETPDLVMMMVMVVRPAVMMVVSSSAQQPGAHDVDDEAERRDRNRLRECDRRWSEESSADS